MNKKITLISAMVTLMFTIGTVIYYVAKINIKVEGISNSYNDIIDKSILPIQSKVNEIGTKHSNINQQVINNTDEISYITEAINELEEESRRSAIETRDLIINIIKNNNE